MAPTTDANALLMAAVIPFLANMSQKRRRSRSHSRSRSRSRHSLAPSTPRRHRTQVGSLPLSPLPGQDSELRACLTDFLSASGLDLTDSEDTLMLRELTPDIIPDIPVDHLCTITGAVEGQIWKFQAYCELWNACLDAKKEVCAKKRRHIE